MSFMNFGRKAFGLKGRTDLPPQSPSMRAQQIFRGRVADEEMAPFDRHLALAERLAKGDSYARPESKCYKATEFLSPEERGKLVVDLVGRPGLYDGYGHNKPVEEQFAYYTHQSIWRRDIEIGKEDLSALLSLTLGNKRLRENHYDSEQFNTLMRLIDSAIKQGAFLTSADCDALAEMANAVRNCRRSYSKADKKGMIARAERLEKLAGATKSATEFLMQRCEGADNPWAIAPGERPNAQFWADLLAETTIALEEIRAGSKSSSNPAWMRNAAAFEKAWPAIGDVTPRFAALAKSDKPFSSLSQHNGKRAGFADPEAYRKLPRTIALAQAHSRYIWSSDQIPGLEVLADLENPDWTALVEHLITQRRATKATNTWEKQALALCQPLGLEMVEAKLHAWLALFHTPVLNMAVYTDISNGERFAATVDQLEAAHPNWPKRHAHELADLGRAVAMVIASDYTPQLCDALHTQLIRGNDLVFKNTRVTDGILGLKSPKYETTERHSYYARIGSWMGVSIENEEFLRGAVWLIALMPNRSRAIDALSKVAQTASTSMSTGDDNSRSKIVANAAIATLIAMGGSDIDQPILHLSKVIDNCTINPPLFKHLNAGNANS